MKARFFGFPIWFLVILGMVAYIFRTNLLALVNKMIAEIHDGMTNNPSRELSIPSVINSNSNADSENESAPYLIEQKTNLNDRSLEEPFKKILEKRRIDSSIEHQVLKMTIHNPSYGERRVSMALRVKGIMISASSIRKMWKRLDLETVCKRTNGKLRYGLPTCQENVEEA